MLIHLTRADCHLMLSAAAPVMHKTSTASGDLWWRKEAGAAADFSRILTLHFISEI